MTEREIKALCKFLIEYGNHSYPVWAKELIKITIDLSSNWQELLTVVMIYAVLGSRY